MYKVSCPECNAVVINNTACHEQGCTGVLQFKQGKHTLNQWDVWTLDVWGNAWDGYEVNDRSLATTIKLSDTALERQIIQRLRQLGLLPRYSRKDTYVVDQPDDSHIYIELNGMPVIQMVAL
jgi:hypothetical protein